MRAHCDSGWRIAEIMSNIVAYVKTTLAGEHSSRNPGTDPGISYNLGLIFYRSLVQSAVVDILQPTWSRSEVLREDLICDDSPYRLFFLKVDHFKGWQR